MDRLTGRAGFLLFAAAAALACSGGPPATAAKIQITDSAGAPDDHALPFGEVAEGSATLATVTVRSAGTADLVVWAVASLKPPAPPFSIADDGCSGRRLAPDATCDVVVRFEPANASGYTGSFEIQSNDPASAVVDVALTGTAVTVPVPLLLANDSVYPPNDHLVAFSDVWAGSARSATIHLFNAGSADLVLGPIAVADPVEAPFEISGDACSSRTIGPDTGCDLSVSFLPASAGSFTAIFDIPSNDRFSPMSFALDGVAVAPPGAQVPRTGQTACYTDRGAEDPCGGAQGEQDGARQAGVPWPTPRFTPGKGAEAECVTDGLTGLVWSRDAGANRTATWADALVWVATVLRRDPGLCGHTDWRLPNRNELRSLVHLGQSNGAAWLATQGFVNVSWEPYWSSTTFHAATGPLTDAWAVSIYDAAIGAAPKSGAAHVWAVRGGGGGAPAPVARTGQTSCWDEAGASTPCAGTGQDGELLAGVEWPSSRFTTKADTTIQDALTGLRWAPDAGTPGIPGCQGGDLAWTTALFYVTCLNSNLHLGYSDWRVPNALELDSLAHAEDVAGDWLSSRVPGLASLYWTSDSDPSATGRGLVVGHYPGGGWTSELKTWPLATYRVWPVRGP